MPWLLVGLLIAATFFKEDARASGIGEDLAALHDGKSGCSLSLADAASGVRPMPLDERHLLFVLPCEDFAYNFVRALYLAADGQVLAVELPSAEKVAPGAHLNQVYSPSWDPDMRFLDSFYKGGNGNCGLAAKWRWTDARFELVEIRRRDTCDQTDAEWPLLEP